MAFPTTPVIKTFTAADALLPTADADFSTLGGATTADVFSNAVRNGSAAYVGNYIDTPATYGPDTECYIDLVSGSEYFGVFARLNTPGGAYNGYQSSWGAGANNLTIQELAGGAQTQIGASVSLTKNAGDALGIEIVGTQISCYVRQSGVWSQQITTSDPTVSAAGAIAFDMYQPAGNITLDNMGGGTYVAGAAADVNNFRPARPLLFRLQKMRRGKRGLLAFPAPFSEPVSTSVPEWFLDGTMALDTTIVGAQDRETFQAAAMTLPLTISGAETRETSLIGATTLPITLTGAIDRVVLLAGDVTLPITLAGAQTRTTFVVGPVTLPITLVGAQTRSTSLIGAMTPTFTLTGAATRETFLVGAMAPTFTLAGNPTRVATLTGALTLTPTIAGATTRTTFLAGVTTIPITFAGDIVVGSAPHALATAMTLPLTVAGAVTRATTLVGAVTFTPTVVGAVVRTTSLTGATTLPLTIAGAQTRTTSVAGTVTFTPALAGEIRRLHQLVGATTFSPVVAGGISVGAIHLLATTLPVPLTLTGNISLLFTEIPGIGRILHVHTGHASSSRNGRLDTEDVPQPGYALGSHSGRLARNKEGSVT